VNLFQELRDDVAISELSVDRFSLGEKLSIDRWCGGGGTDPKRDGCLCCVARSGWTVRLARLVQVLLCRASPAPRECACRPLCARLDVPVYVCRVR